MFDLDSGFVICFLFALFGSAQQAIKQQAETVTKENDNMSSNAVSTAGAAYDAVKSKVADATAVAAEYTQHAGQAAGEKYSAAKGSVGQVLILARLTCFLCQYSSYKISFPMLPLYQHLPRSFATPVVGT